MNDEVLVGYIEGRISFAVNIGLDKTKYQRYFRFKPYISIASSNEKYLQDIREYLELEKASVCEKKKKQSHHNITYSLNIQNNDDIDKLISFIRKNISNFSIQKRDKFLKFVSCFDDVKEFGETHKEWNDKFAETIFKKLEINKTRSNIEASRFDAEQWVKKIKEHLVN